MSPRSLTKQQATWVKEVLGGKDSTSAARIAYPNHENAPTQGNLNRENRKLKRILKKYKDGVWFPGMPERLLDSLNESLMANKWVKVGEENLEIPDHSARGKSRDQIIKFQEIYNIVRENPLNQEDEEEYISGDYWDIRFNQEHRRAPSNEKELEKFKEDNSQEFSDFQMFAEDKEVATG